MFVVLLSVTGLFLNHSDDLDLDSAYLESGWLLDWYGISTPDATMSYAAGTSLVTSIDELAFRDGQHIEGILAPVVGAVALPDTIVIASPSELFLFTDDWALIERLDVATVLPLPLTAIGKATERVLIIKNALGNQSSSHDLVQWRVPDTDEIDWSERVVTPEPLIRKLNVSFRGRGITLERLLLDLHSGRIFGEKGVYLIDAAAVLFLVLAISGVWLWSRRRRRDAN